jgi:hypothetical protein
MLSFKQFLVEDFQPSVDEAKIAEYYEKLLPKLQTVEKEFERVLRASLPKRIQKVNKFGKAFSAEPIVITNIKPLKSVISKVKRGKKVSQIGDYVRGAVLLPDHASVEEFVKQFLRKNQGIIAKHEIKAHPDKQYGYFGSQHIDLNIDGLLVELQVMTQKLWKMKHIAHKIYTRTREEPSGATKSDFIQSQNLFKTGNKPRFHMREEEIPDTEDALFEFLVIDDRWTLFLD